MTQMTQKNKNVLRVWLQAVRPFSFTASLVPVLVGAALAFNFQSDAAWSLFPLIVLCSVLFNAGTNTVSDYYDFRNDVDKDYTHGSSRVIVEGLLKPRRVLIGGFVLFAVACAIGVVFVAVRGLPILILGLIGLAGGIFYTAKPIGYKYIALGDILVFILMGPLMVIGSFFVLTGSCTKLVILASLPVGFLVAAILFANNLRDIRHDAEANVKTLANILGHTKARYIYYTLVIAAYALVVLMLPAGFSPWLLLVFLSLPLAFKDIKLAHNSDPDNAESIAALDVKTAKLHLLFGLLYTVAIAIGKIL